jgi:transcription elongation factor Elf1
MSKTLKDLYLKWYPEGERTCVVCGDTNEAGIEFKSYSFLGHHCPSCYKSKTDKANAERREEITSGDRDTNYENEITCPYCGYELHDSSEYLNGSDDYLGEIDCPDCEETFTCTAEFSVSYSTERIDKEEKAAV